MDKNPLPAPLTADFRVGVKAITTHHKTSNLFSRRFFLACLFVWIWRFFPQLFSLLHYPEMSWTAFPQVIVCMRSNQQETDCRWTKMWRQVRLSDGVPSALLDEAWWFVWGTLFPAGELSLFVLMFTCDSPIWSNFALGDKGSLTDRCMREQRKHFEYKQQVRA